MKKKIMIIFVVAVLALLAASCGGGAGSAGGNPTADSGQSGSNESIASALALLDRVWDRYGEDEKFSAFGGDLSETNVTEGAPGKFDLTNTDELDNRLSFPVASVDKIDDAASLFHLLNLNTFTCGAYHVKNAGDLEAVCSALREKINQKHWICGAPQKLVILTIGDYIVTVYGTDALTDAFAAKVTATYTSARTFCEDTLG